MPENTDQQASGNVHPWPGHRTDDRSAFAIPADQLEKLIARASVLEHAEGFGDKRLLSEEEVISIGQEVGLSAEYVKRALAEYRAESLSPAAPDDHPLVKRIVGPAYARVRRVVPGKAESVHRHLERLLTEQESLRARRQRGTSSVWEPNQSLGSKIMRALDFEGRGYELSKLESLQIAVAAADEHSSLVTMTTDMRNARRDYLAGWTSAPMIILIMFTWVGLISPWVGTLLLLTSLLLVTVGVRWALDSMRRRNVLLLEGVIDQLELRTRSRPETSETNR
jgi:hypothetical protein